MTDPTPEQISFEADLDRLRAHFAARLENKNSNEENEQR